MPAVSIITPSHKPQYLDDAAHSPGRSGAALKHSTWVRRTSHPLPAHRWGPRQVSVIKVESPHHRVAFGSGYHERYTKLRQHNFEVHSQALQYLEDQGG